MGAAQARGEGRECGTESVPVPSALEVSFTVT
jgi:hypothetical protein